MAVDQIQARDHLNTADSHSKATRHPNPSKHPRHPQEPLPPPLITNPSPVLETSINKESSHNLAYSFINPSDPLGQYSSNPHMLNNYLSESRGVVQTMDKPTGAMSLSN